MRQAMTSTTCQLLVLLLLSSNHGQIQTIRIILPLARQAGQPAAPQNNDFLFLSDGGSDGDLKLSFEKIQ